MGWDYDDELARRRYHSDVEVAVEVMVLRSQLEREVSRRVRAEQDRSELSARCSALRDERDAAYKQLRDSESGITKALAQVQQQGAAKAVLDGSPWDENNSREAWDRACERFFGG